MNRLYVVTGAASGIGAATARYLLEQDDRVITCDLHDADVIGDLTSKEGRAALVEGVTKLSGGGIDGIVANAGGGPPETMLTLNFFGAVATLEGLRPLLDKGAAPRAVAVSSIASLGPVDPELVEVCLSMDEGAANEAAARAIAAGKQPLILYGSAKQALNRWCRKFAEKPQWAGAGITLNVVAPGIIDTPASAHILASPVNKAEMGQLIPLHAAYPGKPEQMAALIAWCVGPHNSLMTGQILFADAGFECRVRGERAW